jgi:prophage regulatory protein
MTEMTAPDKILRMRTVLERTGLSRSTLYRKMHDGTFPHQIRISEHCCGWRESAINRWMADPVSYKDEGASRMSNGGSAPSRQRQLA